MARSPASARPLVAVLAAAALALTGVVSVPAAATTPVPDASEGAGPGVRGDGRFVFAVLPDTQQEVLKQENVARFTQRIQWLTDHATPLDLRYVTHSGDVVGWDTSDHVQYQRTRAGVDLLDASGIPWSFSIGNHDTFAVGPGGGARPGGNASVDVRVTTTFNAFYGVGHADALRGTFEPGKIDNSFSTFRAEGTRWLVLNLELWPRTEAVRWAQQVVASHPRHNVVVVTHAMLNADGTVQENDGGYGATSPRYLLDNLALRYANVRFVFSGHAGTFAKLDLTGVHGNPVSLVQTTYHSLTDNPVRLVTVDTRANTYSSVVYGPWTRTQYTDGSATSRRAMAWIRS
ncbi:hypothetical protein ACXR2U_22485 [Jatrophihabitans sp. YIM 134969]